MLPRRTAAQYIGLALLALLAAGLSLAAVLQGRPAAAVRATPAATSAAPSPSTPAPSATPVASTTPVPTDSPISTTSATPSAKLTQVVVVGDSTSLTSSSDGWVARASSALKWEVTNLSAQGMGFAKVASRCANRCTTFTGVVPAIAEAKPDIVVVFGGMADGDNPIGPESREFFTALRKALPKAKVVALSPVMTKQGQLGWIRLHRNNIKTAVAAIGGRFIDVGQPSFNSGKLTAKGQAQVSRKVISTLS